MNSRRKTKNSLLPLSFEEQMGWNLYSISIAITIILLSNGFFMGNHGLNGDFGLDYCIDADSDTPFLGFSFNNTDTFEITKGGFFGCELGHLNGQLMLRWGLYLLNPNQEVPDGKFPSITILVLNHENYRHFVNGNAYGFSNTGLLQLSSEIESPFDYSGVCCKAQSFTHYDWKHVELHSDSYFFVISMQYNASDDSVLPFGKHTHNPDESHAYEIGYNIDIDYKD